MKELSVEELDELRKSGEEFQLIDVREAYEKDIADIGGDHIPLGTIEDDLDKIRKDVKVVVYCRSGARSASAVKTLEQYDMDNLYNLTGVILALADEIDSNMSKY